MTQALHYTVTNKWTAPASAGGLAVWSVVCTWPQDGTTRSFVMLPSLNVKGINVSGTFTQIQSGSGGAAQVDSELAQGKVAVYFPSTAAPANLHWGIWFKALADAQPAEVASFAWGMAQLASNIQTGMQATPVPQAPPQQLPPPQQQMMPQQQQQPPVAVVVEAPFYERPLPLLGIAAVVGLTLWALAD